MKFAFILDPLDALKAYKDSSIAMMRAAARRGHQVFAIQREALVWEGGEVSAGPWPSRPPMTITPGTAQVAKPFCPSPPSTPC
jgi:glutathione synthase